MVEPEIALYYYKQKTKFQSHSEIESTQEFEVYGQEDSIDLQERKLGRDILTRIDICVIVPLISYSSKLMKKSNDKKK